MGARSNARRAIVMAAALGIVLAAIPIQRPAGVAAAGLPAPVLTAPLGGTAPATIVTFAWERVPGAIAYHLVVRHGSGDGQVVIDTTTVNDQYVATVNLGGDSATWQVAAIAGPQEGDWASATFGTAAVAPTLVWPPDGATVTHPDAWPQLTVTRPAGDTSYVRAAEGAGLDVPDPLATDVFPLGEWRWGTKGDRAPGDPISNPPASGPRTFTMTWRESVPELVSPADGATLAAGESLRLRWNPVPGASRYQWRLVQPGADQAIDHGMTLATWADIQTDWYPDDLAGGTWEWRVRAVMSYTEDTPAHAGTSVVGPWSATFAVTLPSTPDVAIVTGPADGAVLDHWPVLAWEAVPGSHGYAVEINDVPAPVSAPITGYERADGTWFSFAAPGGDDNPMAVAAPGTTTRFWRVRTVGTRYDVGEQSVSPWRSFTVVTGDPLPNAHAATPVAPADCASDACADLAGRPLLTWDPVDGAAFYRVFIRWSGGAGPKDAWFDTGSTGLVLPTYRPGTAADRVAWNVVACGQGECMDTMPDARRQFRVRGDAPVATGPADGTVQATPAVEMSWQPAPLAAGGPAVVVPSAYDLEWYITPGRYGDAEDRWNITTSFTNWTEHQVNAGSTLAWRVRTYEQDGPDWESRRYGAWSSFRTITRTTPPVAIVSPADGAVLNETPVLDWSEQAFPTGGYSVSVAKSTTLDHWPTGGDWGLQTGATSARLPDLAPGTYRWQVSDFDNPTLTTGWFTIAGDPRPQVTGPAVGETVRADDALFTWEPYPATAWFANLFVQVSTTPAFEEADIVSTGYTEPTGTAYAPTVLLPTGDLYWRVCARWDCSLPAPVGTDVAPVMAAVGDAGAIPAEEAGGLPATSTPRLVHVTPAQGPDATAPVVRGIAVAPIAGRQLSTRGTTPVRITWTAADTGSGIGAQAVRIRRTGDAWTTIPVSATARSATATIRPGASYTIQVRATDRAGNQQAWVQRVVATSLYQETSAGWTYRGRWTRAAIASALGDATRWSTQAGATVTRTVRASAVGLVAPKGSTRGSVRISVDGGPSVTVRISASPLGARRLAWVKTWPAVGTHRITVTVVGTAGHPRVDLDALVVFR